MTNPVAPPAAPTVPVYPALGSPNFNQEAYTYGSSMPDVSARIGAIGDAAYTNAVAADERAVAANNSAVTATAQADAAMGYRNTAQSAATTATTKASEADASAIAASKLNLGDKASPPTTDNQGAALKAGATYYDTTLQQWRVWNGVEWGAGLSINLPNEIHSAAAKPTPADLDELGIIDSAAEFSLKKLTFAALKTWLASLFVSTTGATMTGGLTVPSINGGQLAGMRNRIINGNFMINQTGFTGTSALGEYGPDCFSLGGSLSGATVSMSLFSDGSFSATGTSHVLLATTSAKASLSASDVVVLEHKIEGLNIADLKWGTPSAKTITLSFRCGLTGVSSGVISVALRNADGSRSYVTTIDAKNSPGTYSVTIPGDSSGTWSTNNSTGIHITWAHCCGSTYSTATTGAWQSGNFVAATTQTNLLTAVDKGFAVTDIQCEVGTVATPFEHRSHGAELALCQRYYEEGHFELRCYSQYGTSNRVSFKVTKRAAPTLTISGIDFAGSGAIGAYAELPGIDGFRAGADWTSTPAYRVVSFNWTASARL